MDSIVEKTFKVVIVGDAGVGKTSLLQRIAFDSFKAGSTSSTIGVDFINYTATTTDGRAVKLQLWDTAGQERFAQLSTPYWRGADAVIAVFDASAPRTMQRALTYLNSIYQDFGSNRLSEAEHPVRVLVANKCDLPDTEKTEDAQTQAANSDDYGPIDSYARCSAKDGQGATDLIERIATKLHHRALNEYVRLSGRNESSIANLHRNVAESARDSCAAC